MRELKRTSDTIIIALLGNKVDLEEKRAVSKREGEEIAQEENVLFFETSAQSGTNVQEAFKAVAKKIRAWKMTAKFHLFEHITRDQATFRSVANL